MVVDASAGVPSGTVTFLFTDMEGSSPAWDRHGPAMAEAQAIHDTILRGAITRANGYVFSTGGDGVGAAFSRAEDALAAAVDAERALGEAAWPEPLRLKVRMGMHTGEALERDGDYYGPAVIRAARLMSLVGGGRIVCSLATQEVVRPRLEPGLDLVRIGTVRLKGLSLPEQVFAVLGPGLAERGDAIETARDLARSRPRELSRIIGRAREIDELTQRVLETWLVTLTGAGGVGKTRLALAVAEAVSTKFPDGVAWVELAPAAQTDDVAQAVADCLGVRAQPGEPLTATVCAGLRGQRLLMVLDNCEHVLSGAAELVAAIGDGCADVVVLATSRERLGLDGERVVPVAPLATGSADTAAVELLVERMDPWDPSVEKDHRRARRDRGAGGRAPARARTRGRPLPQPRTHRGGGPAARRVRAPHRPDPSA